MLMLSLVLLVSFIIPAACRLGVHGRQLTDDSNFDATWTTWFSDEWWHYPTWTWTWGYSEDRHYPIMGAHCNGHFCDNLRFFQGSSGERPTIAGSEVWTSDFSEEGTNYRSCGNGYIMTQMQCKHAYCDTKRLRCEQVADKFILGAPQWEGAEKTFSDDGNGHMMCSMPYSVVTGWSCSGGNCDNQEFQCAQMILKSWSFAPANFAWTNYFTGESPSSDSPITAVRCKGHQCEELGFYQATGSDVTSSTSYWTSAFSEEGSGTGRCQHNYVATGIQCSGGHCDNKILKCSHINLAKYASKSGDFISETFSEEGSHMGMCRPDGYYLTGMICSGSNCDNLQLICTKIASLAVDITTVTTSTTAAATTTTTTTTTTTVTTTSTPTTTSFRTPRVECQVGYPGNCCSWDGAMQNIRCTPCHNSVPVTANSYEECSHAVFAIMAQGVTVKTFAYHAQEAATPTCDWWSVGFSDFGWNTSAPRTFHTNLPFMTCSVKKN
mmetsp:Transcript_115273/g.209832  ORF Transcript_115273/g.209832 Transcript_115273/m.209832 type:complete len:494 (+) Transcript_115273:79-1560(+)